VKENLEYIGGTRNAHKILVGNLKERCLLDDLGVYERMILKWILEKSIANMWTGFKWLRIT
jgi:hypothetical protein